MDQHNDIAAAALRRYLQQARPGFAVLIDAPWGAGKTFFVRKVTEFETDRAVRYVTLNGVDDRTSFRKALLAGLGLHKTFNATETVANVIGKASRAGDVGSMIRGAVEDRMIADLPDTLIFDDIERCTLEPTTLIGLLNDFVEHQNKRIVLLMHSAKHAKSEEFFDRKEKIIGRRIRLRADVEDAYPVFLAELDAGEGKTWLSNNSELVKSVFSESKAENLRILRQVLRDCSHLLDALDHELLGVTDAVERLVRTYLALAIAYAGNEINDTHLAERQNHRSVVRPTDGSEPHKLVNIDERHENAEIYSGHNGSILPDALCRALLVDGYMDPVQLNAILRMTGQFRSENANPLWRQLVGWRDMSRDALKDIIPQAEHYIFAQDKIAAGHFLHIANDLLGLVAMGAIDGTPEKMSDRIVDRINCLASTNQIPPANKSGFVDWDLRGNRFSFGGFATDLSVQFRPIVAAMEQAQREMRTELTVVNADLLLKVFNSDLHAFAEKFVYEVAGNAYPSIGLMLFADAELFAASLLEHVKNGEFRSLQTFFQEQHQKIRNDQQVQYDDFLNWAEYVAQAAQRLAVKEGKLESAMMGYFLTHGWPFARPEAATD